MGLVSAVVPAGELMAEAHALAARIVANPARTLRLTKRLLREGQQQRLQDILELSASFQALAHETPDHHEAVQAFLEKREPRFTGSWSAMSLPSTAPRTCGVYRCASAYRG